MVVHTVNQKKTKRLIIIKGRVRSHYPQRSRPCESARESLLIASGRLLHVPLRRKRVHIARVRA